MFTISQDNTVNRSFIQMCLWGLKQRQSNVFPWQSFPLPMDPLQLSHITAGKPREFFYAGIWRHTCTQADTEKKELKVIAASFGGRASWLSSHQLPEARQRSTVREC